MCAREFDQSFEIALFDAQYFLQFTNSVFRLELRV